MASKYSDIITPAMAKICASRGYLEEAVRLYTHILEGSPFREDLKEALQNLKGRIEKLQDDPCNSPETQIRETGTSTAFESWIRILLRYSHIMRLQNTRKHLMENRQSQEQELAE